MNTSTKKLNYFSTFSGIGGFEIAIKQAYYVDTINGKQDGRGEEYETNDDEEGQRLESEEGEDSNFEEGLNRKHSNCEPFQGEPNCVGFSEIDKYAIQVYEKHFPKHKNYGDITAINERDVPDHDLFVGGFPCQSFSIAGKRRGFEDTRGTLFFDIARILRAKRPENFILENVKGLLSHDEGNTFKIIIRTLDELGYFVEWQVLNSKNFGVPQNRERVFIVGHLGGEPRRKVFPIGSESKEDTRRTGEDVSYAIDANYHKGTNTLKKGRRQVICLDESATNRKGKAWFEEETPTLNTEGRLYVGEDKLETTKEVRQAKIEGKIRRLTPLECERLQGFPDNWTEGVSDTQRYKCCGNAVTVNVVREIVKRLL